MKTAVAACALLCLALPAAAEICNRDAAACEIESGSYRVALPDQTTANSPAVVFLHGVGGSGRGVLGMQGTMDALTERGYAVIAPDGLPREPGQNGGSWSFLPATQREPNRDETAFLAAVVADAADRYAIDPDRVILAGFSSGAFMVNYLACDRPDAFAAYAPVSGGFWRPHPETCAGPVRLFHTHGWTDGTVPLEGRSLGGGTWLQGDIFEGLGLWRDANGCATPAPTGYETTDVFMRRYWTCDPGSALELALFPGGHSVPEGWAEMLIDWFEAPRDG